MRTTAAPRLLLLALAALAGPPDVRAQTTPSPGDRVRITATFKLRDDGTRVVGRRPERIVGTLVRAVVTSSSGVDLVADPVRVPAVA